MNIFWIMLTDWWLIQAKALLHNQHLQGVGGDDVITYISALVELRRFRLKL